MIINHFKPYSGKNCEVTVACNLLYHKGVNISEPMIFGLGEGLGFLYWKMKTMDLPFIGGRIKENVHTENLCNNLGLDLVKKETSSVKKAWINVKNEIDQGNPVGLKLDCYYLEYFTDKIHFAAHYLTMYGYNDKYAHVVDTLQQGRTHQVSLRNLELARNEKGPMSSRNLSYIINKNKDLPDLKPVIQNAIKRNAIEFLNPPIRNIGYKGIQKMSVEVKKWFEISNDPEKDFALTAYLMEEGGTGGALFRNYYVDFLKEALDITGSDEVNIGLELFSESSKLWTAVSSKINKAGQRGDPNELSEVSDILLDIANKEKRAMEELSTIDVV